MVPVQREGAHDAHALSYLGAHLGATQRAPRRITALTSAFNAQVWMLLEEKRVPYTVRKIPMNCYGEKPAWFWQMQVMDATYKAHAPRSVLCSH